jgi:DNA-binding NtrC family response regulator
MPFAIVVEDDPSSMTGLAELVQQEGFAAATAPTLEKAREEIKKRCPDLILTDLKLPDGKGLELFEDLEDCPQTEVVLITGHASVDTAVDALRLGAVDYLTKPVDTARLKTVLSNVARTWELKQEIGSLRTELRDLGRFGLLVGTSAPMQAIYDMIEKVAPTAAPVFITGESGTGKELVARTIHQVSPRRKRPFLPVNCGAISANLIESELFGHEKGSFTGAKDRHQGYFERASKGTLFLDEISEMSTELQVRLLRALESKAIVRVGGTDEIPVDVRIVAATNRPPPELLADNSLREDLFYRLSVFPIEVPPLRDRPEDVELLAEHFLRTHNKEAGTSKKITRAASKWLQSQPWPGNVRELRNVIHRAFIVADDRIDTSCIPTGDSMPVPESGPSIQVTIGSSVADAERRLILSTLEHFQGNKKKSAEVLGISLKTLYTRLSAYGKK